MAHHQPIRRQVSGSRSVGDGPPTPPAEIPDKLYFRIGEAARLCQVPAYVLRFWESEFPQLRPHKGGTGQRLFRRRDVEMARRIKGLLYDEGYTIPGARQLLKSEAKAKEPQLTLLTDDPPTQRNTQLRDLQHGLQDLLAFLSGSPGTPSAQRSIPRRPTSTLRQAPLRVRPVSDNLFEVPASPRSAAPETNDQDL